MSLLQSLLSSFKRRKTKIEDTSNLRPKFCIPIEITNENILKDKLQVTTKSLLFLTNQNSELLMQTATKFYYFYYDNKISTNLFIFSYTLSDSSIMILEDFTEIFEAYNTSTAIRIFPQILYKMISRMYNDNVLNWEELCRVFGGRE